MSADLNPVVDVPAAVMRGVSMVSTQQTVRASAEETPNVVATVANAVSRCFQGRETKAHVAAEEARIVVEGGGVLRVMAGRPTHVVAHRVHTVLVTLLVERQGDLEEAELARAYACAGRIPLTGTEMAELRQQMPLTGAVGSLVPPGALRDVAPIIAVHHMTDFLVMVESLCALGVAAPTITVLDKGYAYRHTARVDAHLRSLGVVVWPWTSTVEALEDHVRRAEQRGRRAVMIDDGGYMLPVLITERPWLAEWFVGLVEQTTSGITKLRPFAELPVPVFSVAQSRLKAVLEPYGIAEAAVGNLRALLPQEKFEGRSAVVVGFGRIGAQIAEVLRARRMRVAVCDRRTVRLLDAHERGFVAGRSLGRLLAEQCPLLVIGASGHTSFRAEHLAALRRDCYLISTTSRDREFAVGELVEEARSTSDAGVVGTRLHLAQAVTATLVADGYPINFHHAESLPNRTADLVLAALVVGAGTLAQPGHGFSRGHNIARTDAVLESCGLLERYWRLYGPGEEDPW